MRPMCLAGAERKHFAITGHIGLCGMAGIPDKGVSWISA